MDTQLFDYYTQELLYMRALADEFASTHPAVGARLGMHAGEVRDPFVERLIESFSLMAGRIQLKLDAEFPRLTSRLLEVLHPNYLRPTPSVAVARLYPSRQEGNLREGLCVPRGSALVAHSPTEGATRTACQFRSTQDVTLWPLRVSEARLMDEPPDVAPVSRQGSPDRPVRGALRIRLTTLGGEKLSELQGLDRLPVYLAGDASNASHVFELLHASAANVVVVGPDDVVRPCGSLVFDAFEPAHAVLPHTWNGSQANNLVQEYFICPSRFWFFTLTGLAEGLAGIHASEAELVVLLHQTPGRLIGQIDASDLALFCTPVVNLFRKQADPIDISDQHTEFHVVPSRVHPEDFEVFAVDTVVGQLAQGKHDTVFRPLYDTVQHDQGNYGRYFSLRREARRPSEGVRRTGARTTYVGTEVYLSLVDQYEAPYSEQLRHLAVTAWMSNRDLPLLMACDGVDDLRLDLSAPVQSVGLIRSPTAPRAPLAAGEHAWGLIRQLGWANFPMEEADDRATGEALRDMLRLFLAATDREHRQQVDSLVSVAIDPVTRRLPGVGPIMFGRGLACTLTVDETGFSGTSPYLMGLIVGHWLGRHASINSFTQTRLVSVQRGELAEWPATLGSRGVF